MHKPTDKSNKLTHSACLNLWKRRVAADLCRIRLGLLLAIEEMWQSCKFSLEQWIRYEKGRELYTPVSPVEFVTDPVDSNSLNTGNAVADYLLLTRASDVHSLNNLLDAVIIVNPVTKNQFMKTTLTLEWITKSLSIHGWYKIWMTISTNHKAMTVVIWALPKLDLPICTILTFPVECVNPCKLLQYGPGLISCSLLHPIPVSYNNISK